MLLPGETQASTGMETFCGGKGLNQSMALAKAGVPVYMAGSIGEEGQQFLDLCQENQVNTEMIRQIPGKSGHTIIQVDKDAQHPAFWGSQSQPEPGTYGPGAGAF